MHSNKYPFLKNSSWYMVFTDQTETDFFAMEKLTLKEKVFTKEIKERMQQPGKNMINIIVKNDSYKGFDKQVKFEFMVHRQVNRPDIVYDEEDLAAAKEPSLMQSMMEMQNENDSDDDEEDDAQNVGAKGNGMPYVDPCGCGKGHDEPASAPAAPAHDEHDGHDHSKHNHNKVDNSDQFEEPGEAKKDQ